MLVTEIHTCLPQNILSGTKMRKSGTNQQNQGQTVVMNNVWFPNTVTLIPTSTKLTLFTLCTNKGVDKSLLLLVDLERLGISTLSLSLPCQGQSIFSEGFSEGKKLVSFWTVAVGCFPDPEEECLECFSDSMCRRQSSLPPDFTENSQTHFAQNAKDSPFLPWVSSGHFFAKSGLNTQARFLGVFWVLKPLQNRRISCAGAVLFDAMTWLLRNFEISRFVSSRSFHFYLMRMRNADKVADGSFRHFRSAWFIRTLQKFLSRHNFD
jgi:hypothetical protein